jgi:hypothetical protein
MFSGSTTFLPTNALPRSCAAYVTLEVLLLETLETPTDASPSDGASFSFCGALSSSIGTSTGLKYKLVAHRGAFES